MILGGRTTEFYMHPFSLLRHIASTGFRFPIVCKSHKSYPSQMRLARLIGRTEKRKLRREYFALFTAISYYVSTCRHVVWVRRVLALFGDAKQAMGEGKNGPVKTGLTRLVATALYADCWSKRVYTRLNFYLRFSPKFETKSLTEILQSQSEKQTYGSHRQRW